MLNILKFCLIPKSVLCDFELATINFIRKEYPDIEIHGCL